MSRLILVHRMAPSRISKQHYDKCPLLGLLSGRFRDFLAAFSINQAAGNNEAHARYRSLDFSLAGISGPFRSVKVE
jgi:hypothetical protein